MASKRLTQGRFGFANTAKIVTNIDILFQVHTILCKLMGARGYLTSEQDEKDQKWLSDYNAYASLRRDFEKRVKNNEGNIDISRLNRVFHHSDSVKRSPVIFLDHKNMPRSTGANKSDSSQLSIEDLKYVFVNVIGETYQNQTDVYNVIVIPKDFNSACKNLNQGNTKFKIETIFYDFLLTLPIDHVLNPRFTYLSEEETRDKMKKNNWSRRELPRISKRDPHVIFSGQDRGLVMIHRDEEFFHGYHSRIHYRYITS